MPNKQGNGNTWKLHHQERKRGHDEPRAGLRHRMEPRFTGEKSGCSCKGNVNPRLTGQGPSHYGPIPAGPQSFCLPCRNGPKCVIIQGL